MIANGWLINRDICKHAIIYQLSIRCFMFTVYNYLQDHSTDVTPAFISYSVNASSTAFTPHNFMA